MKRYYLTLTILLLGSLQIFANGDDIVEDRTEANGVRIIETKMEVLYNAEQALLESSTSYFCLRAVVTNDTTTIYLVLVLNEGKFESDKNRAIIMRDGLPLSMDKGRKLLIKQKSGILELENSVQIDPEDCVSVNVGKLFTSEIWVIKPQYYLSQDNIKMLLSENVDKLRIETNTSYLDRKIYGLLKFKKHFKRLYNSLVKRIETPTSLYDNF